MTHISYELSRYIANEQRITGEANACDHKPTYQSELDKVRADAIARYETGLRLMASMSEKEHERCRKLYRQRKTYFEDELALFLIEREFVVVPKYVGLIKEVRALSKVFD